uniref:Ribonuclease H-like domain-containing protein n=1 Tax=Tanacetum cinerariifolium TaxID=118510 RepID=A0A6L2LV89_TANCI|nr:ribonuclease H-like domain-containing protein [Tanacetum cinerariifolium]
MDDSHPLHLHPNDSYTLIVVSIKLKATENYNVWSCAMLLALKGRNKIGFIDNTCIRSNIDEVLGARTSQRSWSFVFNSSVNNRGNTQTSQTFGNTSRPNNVTRPNNNENRRGVGGSTLVCEHCGFNGYTVGRCSKLIGYPADVGKKNNSSNNNQNTQSFNRRFMNSYNSVGSNFTSSFFDERISKLICLIKEKSLNDNGKGGRDTPYDDNNLNAQPQNEGSNSSHPSSPINDLVKDELGHPQGSNGFANENEMPTTSKNNQPLRRSERSSVFPNKYNEYVVDSKVKYGLERYEQYCIEAINKEIKALYDSDTWDVTDLPSDRKAIGSKWGFMIKYKSNGEIERYKARLVAKSWPLYQLDINNVFLYGDLDETIYMYLPDGYFSPGSKSDYSLFTKTNNKDFLALLVYVDNIIVTGSDIHEIKKFKEFLKKRFLIKDLGKLIYKLGIEVVDIDNGIFLSQRKYCLDLLYEFGLLSCKPSVIPLEWNLFISNEPTDTDPVIDNITEYQKLISKLIYLTHTILDIAYSVHCLSPFMHKPLKSHLKISLKVLRDKIVSEMIATKKISSADQTADVLTKGLDKTQHDKQIYKMGMFDVLQLSLSLISFWKDEDSSRTIFVKMKKCFGSCYIIHLCGLESHNSALFSLPNLSYLSLKKL